MTGVWLALAAAGSTAWSHVLAKNCAHRQSLAVFLLVRTGASFLILAVLLPLYAEKTHFVCLCAMDWALIGGGGLACPLLVGWLLFAGFRRLPVSVAVPVFQAYPALVLLGEIVWLGRTPASVRIAGLGLILLGVSAFSLDVPGRNGSAASGDRRKGILLTAGAALLMAATVLVWNQLRHRLGTLEIAFLTTGISTTALAAGLLPGRRNLIWNSARLCLLSALSGVLVFVVANGLIIEAIQTTPPCVVTGIVSSSVLWTGLLARVTLGEIMTRQQWFAAGGIITGLAAAGLG